jgi:hypothetical protein
VVDNVKVDVHGNAVECRKKKGIASWLMLNSNVMATALASGFTAPDMGDDGVVLVLAVNFIIDTALDRAALLPAHATLSDRKHAYVPLVASTDLYLHSGTDIVARMNPVHLTSTRNIDYGLGGVPECRWTRSTHKKHGSPLKNFKLAIVGNKPWENEVTQDCWPKFLSPVYKGVCEIGCAGKFPVQFV